MLLRKFSFVHLLLLCWGGVFLSGCATDSDGVSGPIPAEIQVSTGFGSSTSGVVTRGGGAVHPSDIDKGKVLPISIIRIDEEAFPVFQPYEEVAPLPGYVARYNGVAWMKFDHNEFYLPNNSKTSLWAWYPSVHKEGSKWEVDTDTSKGEVSFTIDGDTDILLSDMEVGSDNDRFDAAERKKLEFHHLLTAVNVMVFTVGEEVDEDDEEVEDDEVEKDLIVSVSILNTANSCKVIPPHPNSAAQFPVFVYPEEDNNSLFTTQYDGDITLPVVRKHFTNGSAIEEYDEEGLLPILPATIDDGEIVGAQAVGYAMIAPIAKEDKLTLRVCIRKPKQPEEEPEEPEYTERTVDITISLDNGFRPGYHHTIYLNFADLTVRPMVDIKPWDEVIYGNEILGGGTGGDDCPVGDINDWDDGDTGLGDGDIPLYE